MRTRMFTLIVFTLLMYRMESYSQQQFCGTKLSKEDNDQFFAQMAKIPGLKHVNRPNQLQARDASDPYIIPVVFHMLTYGINNGINAVPLTKATMQCRINDVIRIMNDDFNGTSKATSAIDPRFQKIRATLPVKFVLATIDPSGNKLEIPGLDWIPEVDINYGYEDRMSKFYWWGKNGKYYLDVMIVNFPNEDNNQTTQSGHAFLPTQNVVPHITFNHRYIGSVCGSTSDFQFAKVMSHEAGHFFGLRHTFLGECGSPGDGIDDTPPTKGSDGCTANKINSCGTYPNYENLMDYNTTCQSMFTKDQVTVMDFWLNDGKQASYPRNRLWQPANLAATGVVPDKPIARFSSEGNSICTGNSVKFIDESIGLPTSRTWEFMGGTPATSTAERPVVTYNTPGIYTVKLTVSNAKGSNTTQRVEFVRVGTPLKTDISENFSGNRLPESWRITNDDQSVTFVKGTEGGNGDLSSMLMDNYFYKPGGKIDYITLPNIDLSSGASNSKLVFDLSYVKENETSVDALAVEVSDNCGASWTTVYNKSKDDLQTFTGTTLGSNRQFRPTLSNHWRTETVNLSGFVGKSNVLIRFRNTTDFGHRTWIDNVKVMRSTSTTVPPTTTPYCSGTAAARYFYISNVKIANINNTSTGFATNGYSDFTNQTAQLSKGKAETVSVTSNYNNPTVPNHYNVWIDWNQNGSFSDAGEKVMNTTIGITSSATFTVPATAKTGKTRMRVRYSFNKDFDACGFDDYFGEVEDYSVNVSGTTTTLPPATLATPTGIGADVYVNSFYARFNTPPSGTVIELQLLEGGNWVTQGTSTLHYYHVVKKGSTVNYTFRVRAVRGSEVSNWTSPYAVTLQSSSSRTGAELTKDFAYPSTATDMVYFKLPTANSTIEIYDTHGKLVERVVNVSYYNVTSLTNGMYYFRLRSNNVVKTKSILVLSKR